MKEELLAKLDNLPVHKVWSTLTTKRLRPLRDRLRLALLDLGETCPMEKRSQPNIHLHSQQSLRQLQFIERERR